MNQRVIKIGEHKYWSAHEKQTDIIGDGEFTTYSCSYDLKYKDTLVCSFGKARHMLDELSLIKSGEISENILGYFVELLVKDLQDNDAVQFSLNDKFYDVYMLEEDVYSYDVYPDNKETIFDEDGQLIEDMQLDGGRFEGSPKDALEFILDINQGASDEN